MPHQEPVRGDAALRNRSGEVSLTMGVVAFLSSFVPVLGDFLAAPLGFLALVLGAVGIWHNERGHATNFGASLTGATLGTLAVLIVLLMLAVTG